MPMDRAADVLTEALWNALLDIYEFRGPMKVSRHHAPGVMAANAANRLADLGLVRPLCYEDRFGRWGVEITSRGYLLAGDGIPPHARFTRALVDRGRLVGGAV